MSSSCMALELYINTADNLALCSEDILMNV